MFGILLLSIAYILGTTAYFMVLAILVFFLQVFPKCLYDEKKETHWMIVVLIVGGVVLALCLITSWLMLGCHILFGPSI